MKDDAPTLVQKLLHQLLESENYGERKGAAYGLAGLVKGMGILVLKQLDIMSTLTTAIQDKKNYHHREGIVICYKLKDDLTWSYSISGIVDSTEMFPVKSTFSFHHNNSLQSHLSSNIITVSIWSSKPQRI